MATPATGAIALSAVNTELGLASTTQISMSAALTRTLAGVASGAIRFSDLRGKSNRQVVTYVISADAADKVITLGSTTPTSGTYVAGKSDCTITINSNIYVYGTVAGGAGLTVSGGAAGDTLAIVNNGIIMGLGGNGESAYTSASTVGNTALNITTSVSGTVAITNNSYIVGGGGGGAAYKDLANGNWGGGGGGGAGGGSGGATAWPAWLALPRAGGSGGTIGNAGTSGAWAYNSASPYQHTFSGGGGGRRLPFTAGGASGGSTGISAGAAGGTGGGGGGAGGGGAGGYAGGKTTFYASGGGGGFGATGGSAGTTGALVTSSGANGGANNANGGSAGSSFGTGKAGGAAVKHVGVTVSVSGGNTWGLTT